MKDAKIPAKFAPASATLQAGGLLAKPAFDLVAEDRGDVGTYVSHDAHYGAWHLLAFLTNLTLTDNDRLTALYDLFLSKAQGHYQNNQSMQWNIAVDAHGCYNNNILCVGMFKVNDNQNYILNFVTMRVTLTGNPSDPDAIVINYTKLSDWASDGGWVNLDYNDENGNKVATLWCGDTPLADGEGVKCDWLP